MSAITVDGDLIHYEKLGRGRPVILVHGWVGSWRYWIPLMQQLHLRYKVYTLDLPGFGDSAKNVDHYEVEYQVKLLGRFMESLAIHKAAFIGHGLGALVLTRFAHANQDKVARLLLSSAPLFTPDDIETRTPAGTRVLLTPPPVHHSDQTVASGGVSPTDDTRIRPPEGLRDANNSTGKQKTLHSSPTIMNPAASSIDRGKLLESARKIQEQKQLLAEDNPLFKLFDGKTILNLLDKSFKRSENAYDKLKSDVEKSDDQVLTRSARHYDAGSVLDYLRELTMPVLVVHGENDPIIPVPGESIWNYLTIDKEDLILPILLPGVRHFPMLEHESFPRLTTDFLEAEDVSKLEIRERWRRRSR